MFNKIYKKLRAFRRSFVFLKNLFFFKMQYIITKTYNYKLVKIVKKYNIYQNVLKNASFFNF